MFSGWCWGRDTWVGILAHNCDKSSSAALVLSGLERFHNSPPCGPFPGRVWDWADVAHYLGLFHPMIYRRDFTVVGGASRPSLQVLLFVFLSSRAQWNLWSWRTSCSRTLENCDSGAPMRLSLFSLEMELLESGRLQVEFC